MGAVIGDFLPFAVGIAISPIPIIAVILILFSERARENGPTFLAGAVVGLGGATAIVVLASSFLGVADGTSSTLASLLLIGFGLLLVAMAWREWRRRPAPGDPPATLPAWMATVETIAPGRAFALGVLVSGLNPKNLVLAVGGGLVIAQAGLDALGSGLAVVVFVVIGSLGVAVPVAYARLGGEGARRTLAGWKEWLGANNATVLAVLLTVIGVALAGKGLRGLF